MPVVGAAVGGVEGIAEIDDGGMAMPEADVNGLGYPGRQGWVRRCTILAADLVDVGPPRREIAFKITGRRWGEGDISRVDV